MIEKGRMVMIGSGENHLPLIYVGDAAQGILLAGEASHAEGRSYLLVNDEQVTQREFLAAIAAGLGFPAPTRRIPYGPAVMLGGLSENLGRLARRRQPPPFMRYGIRLLGGENRFIIGRARLELGFEPLVNLADGVRRSVMWYRAAYGHAMKAEVRA
jgi:nucleoside-diphosphate-sugar epimerase